MVASSDWLLLSRKFAVLNQSSAHQQPAEDDRRQPTTKPQVNAPFQLQSMITEQPETIPGV
jgi:hypothetical protein